MSRYGREAELSRAALLVAGGGALVGVSQRAMESPQSPIAQVLLVAGAIVIVVGLVAAVRTLFRRRGGAEQ
ncbi:hypothetical protein [Phenylobacterium sp.]|uniref:hypothetical protein n=1 Tax=Phenylobacterium sp. TaxID=1871053 RepID=UPI0035B243A5